MHLRKILPSRSSFLHLRFLFSLFLLPVFLFALSQAPEVDPLKAWLCFAIWHLLVYPASNGFNSYFDEDKGSIALIERPPKVDKSLYFFSLFLDLLALLLSLFAGWLMVLSVLLYGIVSKMYSHPLIRLKKYPITSFLVVFIFQGAFIYCSSYLVISGLSLYEAADLEFGLAGLICSCLIGASYPLTQVYQHNEDAERGDRTLSMKLGINGSFLFSIVLFTVAILLSFVYWYCTDDLHLFLIFLVFLIPAGWVFIKWFRKVLKDPQEANYRNMSEMTFLSSVMMLLYFGLLNLI